MAPGCPPAQEPFSSSSPANRLDGVQSVRLGVALPPRSPNPAQERRGRSASRPSHELGGGLVTARGEAGGRRTCGGRLAAPPAGRRERRGHDERRDRAEAEEHEAVAAVPDGEVAEGAVREGAEEVEVADDGAPVGRRRQLTQQLFSADGSSSCGGCRRPWAAHDLDQEGEKKRTYDDDEQDGV